MQPRSRWQDWLLALAGAWLFVAPWTFESTGDAQSSWNAWIAGGALALLALVAISVPALEPLEWAAGLGGIWVIVSPWVLGFAGQIEAWNAWVVGPIALVVAGWSVYDLRRQLPPREERPELRRAA